MNTLRGAFDGLCPFTYFLDSPITADGNDREGRRRFLGDGWRNRQGVNGDEIDDGETGRRGSGRNGVLHGDMKDGLQEA